MTVVQALVLGIVQGITEFLPISSSGHLALLEGFWKIPLSAQDLQNFDVILHAGTLIALAIIYFHTWVKLLKSFVNPSHEYRILLIVLIVATIPAVIAGVMARELIADSFRAPHIIGFSFVVTGIVLVIGEQFPEKQKAKSLPRMNAFLIGCAQAFALIPGISRSGFTISAGRVAGLSRKEALDFSFLLSAPVIGGATTLTFIDTFNGGAFLLAPSIIFIGFLSSFIVSLLAILFLRKWVVSHSLAWFAAYLVPMGLFLAFM
ncbi:undecaprenyl-diphosphate phosphatase [Patescibacteria group bacterium]|nr:undecaprenyl-diphosphate phosphatase [Patescibacteria group bacterium]